MKRASFLASVVFLFLACAAAVHGQTVINPRTVEFDPSADHSTLAADSQPLVQRYDLQIYLVGAVQPITTANLGKPAPQADGKIRVDFSALVPGWPLADGSYQARVAAIGPTGAASSDPSNTFAFQSCSYTLSGASQSFGEGGGGGSVAVSAGSACGWTASSGAAWVTLATTAGSGTGGVSFTVAANTDTTARTATLTIAGQLFTISQAGAPACAYTLSASSLSFTQGGGSSVVSVSCGSGCAWSAASSASWVTLAASGGSGAGSVGFTVAKNTLAASRTATLVIAGTTVTITQSSRPSAPKKVRVSSVQ